MKGIMEQKVEKMRSQIMSFSNDGMEISLNIPDTADVKETFGTVISTVVEQQEEIVGIHSDITKVVEDNVSSQGKMVDWTKKCIQQLNEQNVALQAKLVEAQAQIRNFAYNIQGFVDQTPEEEAIVQNKFDTSLITKEFRLDSGPSDATGASFRTEPGSNIDNNNAMGMVHEITSDPSAKVNKKKTNDAKMAAKILYFSIPKYSLPASVIGRWHWAVHKTITKMRINKLKLGFNKTRVEKSQTIAEKINRIESDLFKLPITLQKKMDTQNEQLNYKLDSELTNMDTKISELNAAHEAKNLENVEKISTLENTISSLDGKINDLITNLEQKSKDENAKLMDTIEGIEAHLKDVLALDFDRFKVGLADLKKTLNESEAKSEKLTKDIAGMVTFAKDVKTQNTVMENKLDPTKHLVDMLQLDLVLRTTRDSISDLESSIDVSSGAYTAIKQHIDTFSAHYAKTSGTPGGYMSKSHGDELVDLKYKCTAVEGHIKHIRSTIVKMRDQCQTHDIVLSNDYNALKLISTNATALEAANAQIATLNKEIETMKAEAALKAAEVVPVPEINTEKIDAEIEKISSKILKMEKGINKLHKQHSALVQQQTDSSLLVDSDTIAAANDTPAGELESKLRPMISKMIEGSVQRAMSGLESPPRLSRKDTKPPVSGQSTPGRKKSNGGAVFPAVAAAVAAVNGTDSADGTATTTGGGARKKSVKMAASDFTDELSINSGRDKPAEGGAGTGDIGNNAAETDTTNADGVAAGAKGKKSMGDDDDDDEEFPTGEDDDNAHSEHGYDLDPEDDEGDDEVGGGAKPKRPLHGSFAAYSMGGGSGKIPSNFDPSSLLHDIGYMRDEASQLRRKLEEMANDRPTVDQAEAMIKQIFKDERRNETKSSKTLAVEDIDKTIREIIQELITVRKEHQNDVTNLRSQFDTTLILALNKAVAETDDINKQSLVNTRSMCIGCGRSSLVNGRSSRPISPAFLPTIGTQITPGPDIIRGGFKMPVRHGSPFANGHGLSGSSVLDNTMYSPTKRKVFSVDDVRNTLDGALSPAGTIGLGGESSYESNNELHVGFESDDAMSLPAMTLSNYMSNMPQSSQSVHSTPSKRVPQYEQLKHGQPIFEKNANTVSLPINIDGSTTPRRASSAATAIRHAQGRSESSELRPIFRKGFPAKKSNKAEATFAPERFDLPGTPQSLLKVTRIANVLQQDKEQQGFQKGAEGGNREHKTHKIVMSASVSALK